jgi:3-oxoacyl-[acyl-carrier protein] reductase
VIDLNGKAAIVTGSGRGIGRAIATQLAQAGARVMINDLDPAPCQETASSIPGAASCPGDMTDAAFPQKLVDLTLQEFGAIDIVVNNAGYTWDNVIQKTTDEQFQAMLDIHLVAPFRLLRAASGWLRETAKKESAEGRRVMRKVVNITSIAATDGGPGQAGYGSGKAGVIGLTRVLAKEWGRYNINVNCVGFGLIETRLIQPLTAQSRIEVKGREIQVGVQQKALDTLTAVSPLGRSGTPDEAAGPVVFFCSPLADFITGEVLIVSGGMHF